MKAVVTGGTGFIGGHLVRLLIEEGHAVRVFTRRPDVPGRLGEQGVEAFQGDLRDYPSVIRALEGMEVLYHVGEIKNTTRAASEANLRLIEHILENIKETGVRRFVFISSLSVAGMPGATPATEETGPEAELSDHYTSYKRRAEGLIREGGMEYSVLRPAPVYGPGSRFMRRVIDAVDRFGPVGIPFVGDGKKLAPLVYAKDLARAIYLAGTTPEAKGQLFNITDGLRHTWADFLQAIAVALGRNLRIIPLSPVLLRFPSIFFDFFSDLLGMELDLTHYMDYFSRDLLFDNSKAMELLGWKPGYTLEEGVREMVREVQWGGVSGGG